MARHPRVSRKEHIEALLSKLDSVTDELLEFSLSLPDDPADNGMLEVIRKLQSAEGQIRAIVKGLR